MRYITSLIITVIVAICYNIDAHAGQSTNNISLADLLPEDVICYLNPPDRSALQSDYNKTIINQIANMSEFHDFTNNLDKIKKDNIQYVAQESGARVELIKDIIDSYITGALLNIETSRNGSIIPTLIIAINMKYAPDREEVYDIFKNIINKPEVIKRILKSNNIESNITLKSLVQEENLPGSPPTLRIGGELRIAVINNLIIIYRGASSTGFKEILNYSNNKPSLANSKSYQLTYKGADTKPGMGFFYLNMRRIIPLLGLADIPNITNFIDSIGLSTVQIAGISTGYYGEGIKQSIYLYAPSTRIGLLSSLLPNGKSEENSKFIIGDTESFLSAKIDLTTFIQELPYFISALTKAIKLNVFSGGFAKLLTNDDLFGVSIKGLIESLGDELTLQPYDDTIIFRFDNVNLGEFNRLIKQIEKNSGERFKNLKNGAYEIKYISNIPNTNIPLIPAFCALARPQSNSGVVYIASHPQAISAFINKVKDRNNVPLTQMPDFKKVAWGIDNNSSLFFYTSNKNTYKHIYNALLPALSLLNKSDYHYIDIGLLPTADVFNDKLFGAYFSIKSDDNAIKITSYSPFGIAGVIAWLADRTYLSNPAILAYLITEAINYKDSLLIE